MLPNIIGFGSKVRFSFPLLTDIIIALLYVSKEIVQESFLRSSLPNTPSGSVSKTIFFKVKCKHFKFNILLRNLFSL